MRIAHTRKDITLNVCISQRHKREMQTAVIYPLVLLLILIPVLCLPRRFPVKPPSTRKRARTFRASTDHQKKTQDVWYTADCYTTEPPQSVGRHSTLLTDLLLIHTALFFFTKEKALDLPNIADLKSSAPNGSNWSLRAPPESVIVLIQQLFQKK